MSGLDISQISSVLKNMDNPKEILKQCLVIGTEKEMSVSEIVVAKSKLEG